MTDQKQPENVEYFNCLGSMITNAARCTCEIESRIAMAKVAFNKKKTLFTKKWNWSLRKKLVNCYIWSIALYGAETGTLWKVDQKYLEILKCGAGEGKKIFGLIVWERKKYYKELKRRETSYEQ